jgi:predicted nucleic acid-binding protein
MKVLIDTNVILDVFMKREPHVEFSVSFLNLCGKKIPGCITASQTTDIFYMLCRLGKDTKSAGAIIKKLTSNLKLLDVTAADVQNALVSEMADYEDSLLVCCAKRQKMEYIITRNEKDFNQTTIHVLSPQKFLEQFSNKLS